MAQVFEFQTQRFFQTVEFQDYWWTGITGAGNFTGISACPDPFAGVADLCQVTQVWFSQPASGGPVANFTVRKKNDGVAMAFFAASVLVRSS